MYTVLHEEKHIVPVRATTSSSVRSGKHSFCSNEVWLKLVALWAAVKLYFELAFADILSHPDWGRNWTKMWKAIVHLKAIPVFSVELLIFLMGKHPSLCYIFSPLHQWQFCFLVVSPSFGLPVFRQQELGCGGTHSLPVIFSSNMLTTSESVTSITCRAAER